MTLVKICGITNLDDARDAIDAGADLLGFNFYQPSSRYLRPEIAREIIDTLPKHVLPVGVFVNEQSPEQVKEIAKATGIRAVQLHGDESAAYCEALSEFYVIKTLAVGADFVPYHALNYRVNAILLDAKDERLRGGTGRLVNWDIANEVRRLGQDIFLAGGLSAENVETAIRIVAPYAVDACSSLESAPGKKDKVKVSEFITRAHGVKP
jgi:phosphoribosylanthranilate isomerase